MPCIELQRIIVSDTHVLRSHTECPLVDAIVNEVNPKLVPCNVTLVDPVDARFAWETMLMTRISDDRSTVDVPRRSPTEYVIPRLAPTPWATLHRIMVSPCQVVRSHNEAPALDD
jgi:hypothetical protein